MLVVLYHTSYWLEMPYPEWLMSTLRIWGIYGVEGFFVISGIALSVSTKPTQFDSATGFYVFLVRRYSRILPLYATLLFAEVFYKGAFNALGERLFEISMLFGFAEPALSSLIGGWSIGVEFVFYFLFPLLALICRNDIHRAAILALLAIALSVQYSTVFDASETLASQNNLYVNPVNHFVFFASGYFLGVLHKSGYGPIKRFGQIQLLSFCLVLFVAAGMYGQNSDQAELMVSHDRAVLSLLVIALVGAVMHLNANGRLASFLGDISYAIYLIHPLVIFVLLPRMPIDTAWVKLALVFAATIPLAYLSHRYFEMPAQRLIRKVMHA